MTRDQAGVTGVAIVTVARGEIGEQHVGLKGTMNALFLKDLAAKTHRGLRGPCRRRQVRRRPVLGYKVLKQFDARGADQD